MDKVLFVATIDQHIRHFHVPYLKWFKENNYEVHVASSGKEIIPYVDQKFNIPFERSPFKTNNVKAYKQLKKLIKDNDYKVIHCHTPVGGVITRLASISKNSRNTSIIYTAHGFHFFKGSPKRNWLIFYSLEKFLSKFTTCLITINQEDYKIAKKKFNAKNVKLINGVGIDLNRFAMQTKDNKIKLRKEFNFNIDDFILIYVGELSHRKNQTLLIDVMKKSIDLIPNLKLLLVGSGPLKEDYLKKISDLKLDGIVNLLGYRTDIDKLMTLSDAAVSSSLQEGLPVNVMEAMAIGLPLIVTNCRGNKDLVLNNKNGFVVGDENEFSNKLYQLYSSEKLKKEFSKCSRIMANTYSEENILKEMEIIYKDYL